MKYQNNKRTIILTGALLLSSVYYPIQGNAEEYQLQSVSEENKIVQIPDVNLKEAISKELYKPPYEDITLLELQTLKNLSVSNVDIKSLEGLQYATGLENLSLTGTNLSDISHIGHLKGLKHLDLGSNQISDISPLANLEGLVGLDLNYNLISDISALKESNMASTLTSFSANSNQLKDISALTAFTGIRDLNLGDNQITDIRPLAGFSGLSYAYLADNKIEDVTPLSGLTSLDTLYIHTNNISDISPLEHALNIRDLYINANNIEDISPLQTLTELRSLGLSSNDIVDISPLRSLKKLNELSLSYNPVTDISPIKDTVSLLRLDMDGLPGINTEYLGNLIWLQGLSMDKSQINDVSGLANLTKLESLSLSHNEITDISALITLDRLYFLGLSYNYLTDISPLSSLEKLTHLYVSYNQLTDISALSGRYIRHFEYNNNFISGKRDQYKISVPTKTIEGLGAKPIEVPLNFTFNNDTMLEVDDYLKNIIQLHSKNGKVDASFDVSKDWKAVLRIQGKENGEDELSFRFHNEALNQTIKINHIDVIVPEAPTVTPVTDTDQMVKGKAKPYSNVVVTNGKNSWENSSDMEGKFQVEIPKQQAGTTLEVYVYDFAGNVSERTTVKVTDGTPPDEPAVDAIYEGDEVITGAAEPLAFIEVNLEGHTYTDTTDVKGTFRISIPRVMAGSYMEVTATDATGNKSKAVKVEVKDITPPPLPKIDTVTEKSTLVSGKSEPGAAISILVNEKVIANATSGEDGSFKAAIPLQEAGSILAVTATDSWGNVSEVAYVTVMDITAPDKPKVNEITTESTTITGITEPGARIEITSNGSLFAHAFADESGYFEIPIENLPADIQVQITASDKEGNVSEPSILTVTAISKGWKLIEGKWYYFDPVTGINKIGWLQDKGKWYYMNATGTMHSGWLKDSGKWYYLSGTGAMKTGWLQHSGKWYYLDGSGAMKTGWLEIEGKWYYLDGNGVMKVGWLKLGNTWYYLEGSGAMKTGWLLTGGKWYYLYQNGAMAYNTIIDGSRLGSDGAWIK